MTLTIASMKSLFRLSPHYLVLQLSPAGIFYALASIKKQLLIIHSIEYAPCTDNEITNTSIANPTKLVTLVHTFLTQHNQPNLPVICFSSLLQGATSSPQHVLQHLLALSKVSGPVIGLFNSTPLTPTTAANTPLPFVQTELTNLIDYVSTPDSKNWHQRLRHCVFIIAIPLCSTIGYGFYQSSCLKNIRLQEKHLNDYLNNLKPRVQQVKALETQNGILKDRINTIQDLTEEHEIPAHICQTIAKHIPPNTWLADICIGPKLRNTKQANKQLADKLLNDTPKTVSLHIEGKTTEPDEISTFLEALTSALPNSTISIEHITRAKQVKQVAKKKLDTPYNFTLTGVIQVPQS